MVSCIHFVTNLALQFAGASRSFCGSLRALYDSSALWLVVQYQRYTMALSAFAARYNALAQQRPLLVNGVLGFIIAAAGDVAAQKYFEDSHPLDTTRTAHMGIIRMCVMAPFLSVYFPWLNRTVPGKTMPRVLARVALDQAVGSPVSITMIFAASSLLQGRPADLPARLQQQLLPTMQSGAMFWPFVHSLNFRFVPVHHQAMVAHVASVWWNAVLSYRANMKLHSSEVAAAQEGAAAVVPALAVAAVPAAASTAVAVPAQPAR